MKKIYFYQTKIGEIGIVENENSITNLYFQSQPKPLDMIIEETVLLKEAFDQLQNYIFGRLKDFSIPLAPTGTRFMMNVWNSICEIPYGET